MLYEILRADRAGTDSDLYALLAGRSMHSGKVTERELTGTVPLRFRSDGSALLDWHITGAAGGVSAVNPNLYPPVNADSVNRNYWGTYPDGGLYGEPCYNKYSAWGGLCNAIYADAGIYTFSVYVKVENDTNKVKLYVRGNSHYTPNYEPWATVVGTDPVCSVGTNYQRFVYTFEVTEAGYVYPRVEKTADDGNNVFVTCFQLEKAASASSYISYNAEYCLPVRVTGRDSSGEVTSTVNIPLHAPLGSGEILTKTGTGIVIPTFAGKNVIDTDTAIPPSEVYIRYMG